MPRSKNPPRRARARRGNNQRVEPGSEAVVVELAAVDEAGLLERAEANFAAGMSDEIACRLLDSMFFISSHPSRRPPR